MELDFNDTNLGISNPVTLPFSAYKLKLIRKDIMKVKIFILLNT